MPRLTAEVAAKGIENGVPDEDWMLAQAEESDSENDGSYVVQQSDHSSPSSASTIEADVISEPEECDKEKEDMVTANSVGMVADSGQKPGSREALILKKRWKLGPQGQKERPLEQPFLKIRDNKIQNILWASPANEKQRGKFYNCSRSNETQMIEFEEVQPKVVATILKEMLKVKNRKDLKMSVRSFFTSLQVPEACFNTIFWQPRKAQQENPAVKAEVIEVKDTPKKPPAASPPAVEQKPKACRRLNFDEEPKPKRAKIEKKMEKDVVEVLTPDIGAAVPEVSNLNGMVNTVKVVIELKPESLSRLPAFLNGSIGANFAA